MCPIAFRLQQLAPCIIEYCIKIKTNTGGAPKGLGLEGASKDGLEERLEEP